MPGRRRLTIPALRRSNCEELDVTRIEVSLLSALAADAGTLRKPTRWNSCGPGVDGLILEYGRHRGTFLPQVWESLPDPARFLRSTQTEGWVAARFLVRRNPPVRYQVTKWQRAGDPGQRTMTP